MNYKSDIRKVGSPGYDLEWEFYSAAYCCSYVHNVFWLSEHRKATFDFQVNADSGKFLIDVVGHQWKYKSYSLYTDHKDIQLLLDYAHNQHVKACYLAFKMYEINRLGFKQWRFLKITEDLPSSNIYISRDRSHGLKTYDFIFRDKRSLKTLLAEKVKRKYALRKEADSKLTDWIYNDVKA